MTDFATITASSTRSSTVRPARDAAAEWLGVLLDLGRFGNNLNNQVGLGDRIVDPSEKYADPP